LVTYDTSFLVHSSVTWGYPSVWPFFVITVTISPYYV